MTSDGPLTLRGLVAGKDPLCLGGVGLAVLGAVLLPTLLSNKGPFTGEGVRVAGLMLLLATICWIESESGLIVDLVTLPGTLAGVLIQVFTDGSVLSALGGVAIGYGIPALGASTYRRIRGQEGLGPGCVKLSGMIGSFLGSGAAFLTVGFAAAFGLVLAIIVAHVSTRISLETGPLLTAGAIASVLALHS